MNISDKEMAIVYETCILYIRSNLSLRDNPDVYCRDDKDLVEYIDSILSIIKGNGR